MRQKPLLEGKVRRKMQVEVLIERCKDNMSGVPVRRRAHGVVASLRHEKMVAADVCAMRDSRRVA